MNENARIRKRESFAVSAGCKQQRSHRSTLSDADRRHVGPDELHRVVDSHAGSDRATRAVYVEGYVAVRVFSFEKQKLSYHKIGDGVVDRSADEDDVVFQQSRIDIEGAFSTRSLFDDHWYKSHLGFVCSAIHTCSLLYVGLLIAGSYFFAMMGNPFEIDSNEVVLKRACRYSCPPVCPRSAAASSLRPCFSSV